MLSQKKKKMDRNNVAPAKQVLHNENKHSTGALFYSCSIYKVHHDTFPGKRLQKVATNLMENTYQQWQIRDYPIPRGRSLTLIVVME